jgi:hypothetical protein
MRPVVVLIDTPVGRPVAAKEVGEFVAVIAYVNDVPAVAVAVAALVITGGGGLTVSVSVAVPAPPALAAETITEAMVASVGTPVIAPVVAFTARPEGRLVAA